MFPECGAKSNSNVGIQLWSFHWKCCICSVVRVVVCYLVAYMICNQETVLNLIIYLWTGSERFWRPHMTSHVISGRGQGRPVCVGEHGVFASIIHTNGRAWKLSLGVGGVSEKKKWVGVPMGLSLLVKSGFLILRWHHHVEQKFQLDKSGSGSCLAVAERYCKSTGTHLEGKKKGQQHQ